MSTPKSLLDWFGKPLVVAQVESLAAAGIDSVVVVAGAVVSPLQRLLDEMPSVQVVVNRDYKSGKASSVRTGARALASLSNDIVLLAVDQPRPPWVIRRVLSRHVGASALITSPRFQGHGGHPLVFSAALRPELENVSDELEGVRDIMSRHSHEVNGVEFSSPIVRVDLNTPADYQAALETYASMVDESS